MKQPESDATTVNPEFMRAAIKTAKVGVNEGNGGPFGACIVKGNNIVAVAHNTVFQADATCHAEINAIRFASKVLDSHDLRDCVIYSTTEPCPMCFAAIHWANIDRIVYGTNIDDVKRLGFRELSISNYDMRRLGGAQLDIVADFLRQECADLLDFWQAQGRPVY
jgi:tRNA(Arg) A34 adenosine deaminase TadA